MGYSLKIEKKKMEIELYGTKHLLRFPTTDEVEALTEKLDAEKDPAKLMKLMREYLESLGLSKDVKVDSVDFTELIAFVNNPKKN